KGSGGDMATIDAAGFSAVRLRRLRRLRERTALADGDMVRIKRENLLDPLAPDPSVEILLHAFLPHKFIDHTHASAVLSLVDQPNGELISAEVYNGRVGIVPYLMPGFALASKAAAVYEAKPKVEGLVLLKHGIVTFGGSAREAYERMIAMVALAEEYLARNRKSVFVSGQLPQKVAAPSEVAPILRGLCALKDERVDGAWRRLILEFGTSPAVLNYVNGAQLGRDGRAGVVPPDHTIRTKNWPLIVAAPEDGKLLEFKRATQKAVTAFIEDYKTYFARHNARVGATKAMLDPLPRVALVPGLGLYGLGPSKRDARIAADLAEAAIETITDAEAIGRLESIGEAEMFDMEYWPLEQAKLGKSAAAPLAGQIAAVTGAAGAIGVATAKAFADAGAEVALLDLDESAVQARAKTISAAALGLKCDVTSAGSVRAAF